ncbi:MAG: insulinase family protein [Pyrinomonadaceae bacterium]
MQSTILKTSVTVAFIMVSALCAFAQESIFSKPRTEKLLNGLTAHVWQDKKLEKVKLDVRVHSGAAFDPQGKEGLLKLLSEVMFPSDTAYGYFEDELGGSLKVAVTHDYLQISAEVSPDKFLDAVEFMSAAFRNVEISKETTTLARDFRVKQLEESAKNPAILADNEALARLWGVFPYGRPAEGDPEAIGKADFADLVFLQGRIVNADNSTVVVIGNVDPGFAHRAIKRYFGGWHKGTGKIASNFTLPEKPDTAPVLVNTDFGKEPLRRLAVESVSRKSDDYFAAKILCDVLQKRASKEMKSDLECRFNYLRGSMLFKTLGASGNSLSDDPGVTVTKVYNPLLDLLTRPVTKEEFEAARNSEVVGYTAGNTPEVWFDLETYELGKLQDQFKKLQATTLENVLGVASRIAKNPFVDLTVMPLEGPSISSDTDPKDPSRR